jgi:hypothetical protein
LTAVRSSTPNPAEIVGCSQFIRPPRAWFPPPSSVPWRASRWPGSCAPGASPTRRCHSHGSRASPNELRRLDTPHLGLYRSSQQCMPVAGFRRKHIEVPFRRVARRNLIVVPATRLPCLSFGSLRLAERDADSRNLRSKFSCVAPRSAKPQRHVTPSVRAQGTRRSARRHEP